MSTRAFVQIHAHDVPEEVFEPFARVFGLQEGDNTRWVMFTAEGVSVALFAVHASKRTTEEVS